MSEINMSRSLTHAPDSKDYAVNAYSIISPEAAEQLRQRYLADAPAVLQHDYLASLHAAFTAAEVEQQLNRCGLQQLQVAEVDDRYLEIWGQLP